MAARNELITVPADTWTELTDNDVTSITFQIKDESGARIAATTGADPTETDDTIFYDEGQGERNVALTDLFPGATSAVRVFAHSPVGSAVFVSHAA